MKRTSRHVVVLVTVPDSRVGRRIARAVLQDRLAACVNLLPKLESHYWWKGRIESSAERLLLIKTDRARLSELENIVRANHPYDTPEFVALPIQAGSQRYLRWIDDSLAGR